jgi:glycosyltransferase involved in cell wall biosynthesis
MNYAALVALYRRAVAVIVPSIWYEPFGLIVIEAFAQRTPVIVNNAGALPELVADSDGGIVYNSTDELKSAVAALLYAPDYRNTLGQNGYQAYLARWTEKQHLDQYLGLIDDIAARKGSGH